MCDTVILFSQCQSPESFHKETKGAEEFYSFFIQHWTAWRPQRPIPPHTSVVPSQFTIYKRKCSWLDNRTFTPNRIGCNVSYQSTGEWMENTHRSTVKHPAGPNYRLHSVFLHTITRCHSRLHLSICHGTGTPRKSDRLWEHLWTLLKIIRQIKCGPKHKPNSAQDPFGVKDGTNGL